MFHPTLTPDGVLGENTDGVRQYWPRVPLPDSAVPGVTARSILPALAAIGIPAKAGGGQMTEADRAMTAGWGHAGKGGAVMPGRGRIITRDYAGTEAAAREAPHLDTNYCACVGRASASGRTVYVPACPASRPRTACPLGWLANVLVRLILAAVSCTLRRSASGGCVGQAIRSRNVASS